ncbi:MAG: Sir2 family NAD-dependent protein deacetylase [Candidatus Krumholzibacteriia bacterium]
MDQLIALLKESRRLVVFSGAGVSTLSGLPDFRGEHGVSKELDGDLVFDLAVFHRDPRIFYSGAADLVYGLADHEPSLVHRECARLEATGKLMGVITQNIDMLHQRAGSERVVELHGSPAVHACLACGRPHDYAWAAAWVRRGEVPRCESCGGVVKPAITFFGEMLPPGALETAAAWAADADLVLVLGSSLVVQPAASLPLVTLRAGGRLAIVNREPTPLDHLAAARHHDLQEVFTRIAAEV